jgi:hypothetical protein
VTPATPFGRDAIESILPHRAPFLLLDEVVELVPGERVWPPRTAVPEDGWWFAGHFPERPGDAWRADRRGDGPDRRGRGCWAEEENRGRIAFLRESTTAASSGSSHPARHSRSSVRSTRCEAPIGRWQGDRARRGGARGPRHADVRGGAMIRVSDECAVRCPVRPEAGLAGREATLRRSVRRRERRGLVGEPRVPPRRDDRSGQRRPDRDHRASGSTCPSAS